MSNYNSNLSNKSYFRSIIPKDLRKTFGGKDEFRLSLRYVINGDTKILCLRLKEITDKLFTEIRSGMKNLSLDDIKNILRIEVRKQIKHTQHYYLGTNVFDEEQTIQSLEMVSSRETKMKEELYGENIKDYEKELDKKLEGILTSLEIEIETNSINYKNLRRQFIQLYLLRFYWIRSLIKETGNVDEDDFRREVDTKLGMGLFPDLQPTDLDLLAKLQTSESILGSRILNNSTTAGGRLSSNVRSFIERKKIEGKSPKEIGSDGVILEEFVEIVGDIDISSITYP